MENILEGLLYVQGDLGLTVEQVMDILEIEEDRAKELIYSLKKYYDDNNRGLRINYLGNTFKLTTREEHKEYYKKLVENPSTHILSNSALETLAIIAYNEPITRIQVDNLRGVDSSYIMRRLVAKGLIKECGRSDIAGHPIIYKTTDEFLDYFGLANKEELPKIESIVKGIEEKETDLFSSIYKEEDEL